MTGLTSCPKVKKLFCSSRANSKLLVISWNLDRASFREKTTEIDKVSNVDELRISNNV